MKISTKGRYGLRVMMELARNYGRGPLSADIIAQNQDISRKYIHLLVMKLKSTGLIRAIRGPGGGYELAKTPSSITALDVFSALEGRILPVECVADASACRRAERCAARDVWCDVAGAAERVLSGLTLQELSARQLAREIAAISYYI
jgi:Rrf2 family cysteine metabolism transcriptional repressor